MKTKKVFANITNSIGELDVLIPLFVKLNAIGSYRFTLHLTSSEFIEKYKDSSFYKFCINELELNLIELDLLPIRKKNKSFYQKIYNRILYAINVIKMLPHYFEADIIIHDYTSHRLILYPIYIISKIKKSKIFAIPHGLGVQIDTAVIEKADILGDVSMLIFDHETINFHKKYGYEKIINIGYVKFYDEWIDLLSKYKNTQEKSCSKKIVILSRHVHELYMDYEKYEYLLTSFFEYVTSHYISHDIYIKIHPRESEKLILEIAKKSGVAVHIVRDHPAVACMDAILVVSFWTSAIIDASALGVPAIEYYIEADNFRVAEPSGSVFKKIGFKSVSDIHALELISQEINSEFNPDSYYKFFYERVNLNKPSNIALLEVF